MKTQGQIDRVFLVMVLGILSLQVFNVASIHGQVKTGEAARDSRPADESFEPGDGLLVPWRSGGCKHSNPEFRDKNCYHLTAAQFDSAHMLSLYDRDGSNWYTFSVSPKSPQYFVRNAVKEFRPFAVYPHSLRNVVLLRLIRESGNWYEVEVNEETEETKFVRKADPMWAKDTWREWLFEGFNLKIGSGVAWILDQPGGRPLFEPHVVTADRLLLQKVEGDWALVRTGDTAKQTGWVQWREGRKILVGCIFNDFTLPDSPNN